MLQELLGYTAEKGDMHGRNNLAEWLLNEKGRVPVQTDELKARRLFELSAKAGHHWAQYKLLSIDVFERRRRLDKKQAGDQATHGTFCSTRKQQCKARATQIGLTSATRKAHMQAPFLAVSFLS